MQILIHNTRKYNLLKKNLIYIRFLFLIILGVTDDIILTIILNIYYFKYKKYD